MDFRPIATRCRLSIILTLTLHRRYPGLHFPSSIALIAHSCQSHTHYITPTQILLKLFSTILYSHYIAIASLRSYSHSQFPVSSLALFLVCLPVSRSLPVFSFHLITTCPEVYSLFWNYPLPCFFGLCLHLAWTLAHLVDSCLPHPQDSIHRRLTHAFLWILSCLAWTIPVVVVVDRCLFYDHTLE